MWTSHLVSVWGRQNCEHGNGRIPDFAWTLEFHVPQAQRDVLLTRAHSSHTAKHNNAAKDNVQKRSVHGLRIVCNLPSWSLLEIWRTNWWKLMHLGPPFGSGWRNLFWAKQVESWDHCWNKIWVGHQIDPDPVMFAMGWWLYDIRFLKMPSSLSFSWWKAFALFRNEVGMWLTQTARTERILGRKW